HTASTCRPRHRLFIIRICQGLCPKGRRISPPVVKMEVCRTQKCIAACCRFGQPFKEHYMSSTSSSATENQFDIIVIGAGPVGEVLVQSTMDDGLRTANVGCVL